MTPETIKNFFPRWRRDISRGTQKVSFFATKLCALISFLFCWMMRLCHFKFFMSIIIVIVRIKKFSRQSIFSCWLMVVVAAEEKRSFLSWSLFKTFHDKKEILWYNWMSYLLCTTWHCFNFLDTFNTKPYNLL